MPAVGSSKKSSSGSWTRVEANASRRLMPPDSSSTRLCRSSLKSTKSSASSAGAVSRGRRRWWPPRSAGSPRRTVRGAEPDLRQVAEAAPFTGTQLGGIAAQGGDTSRIRTQHPGHEADGGGLASATRPDQSVDRASSHGEGQLVDGLLLAEGLAHVGAGDTVCLRSTRRVTLASGAGHRRLPITKRPVLSRSASGRCRSRE